MVVEVDGGSGHASYGQMVRDRERDLYLRRAGFSVLRYSWWQVTGKPSAVAVDVRRTLRGRGYRRAAAA